jgi:SsrA-binding protein
MVAKSSGKQGGAPIAANRKAYRDYELLERFEAGLGLLGSEVKSLRAGRASLDGSYARITGGECWLVASTIPQYSHAGGRGHDPSRTRKLLLHKSQIRKLADRLDRRGFTLVPLRIYFSKTGLAKAELALACGKKQYDKRAKIAERQQKRDIGSELCRRRKKTRRK